MSKVFDPIRARSSVDALEMLCRSHPECAVNVTALREELDAADEQIEQLARALRKEVEPQTFMGEPVPHPANRAARMAMDPQKLREMAASDGVRAVEAPSIEPAGWRWKYGDTDQHKWVVSDLPPPPMVKVFQLERLYSAGMKEGS